MAELVPVISKKVDIDGEIFSLEIVPKTSTQLVKAAKDDLTSNLDLPGLVDDLHKLGNFCRVAYYGVAGSTELQIKVQRVGFTVAKLCQESDITIVLFKNACTEVVETLQACYEYLCDGLEDIAIDNMKSLSEIAGKMAEASDKLMIEFDKAKEMVEETLADTRREKGSQEQHKDDVKKRQEEEKLKKEQEEEKQKAAAKFEDEKKKQYLATQEKEMEAEKRLDKVIEKKNSFGHQALRELKQTVMFWSRDSKDPIDDQIENEKRRAAEAREEKLETLKEVERQGEAQLKATLALKECVLRIRQAKAEEGVSEAAISALHGAQGALSAITVIMMQASKFWRMMHEHCKQMTNERMIHTIEKLMEKPEAMRLRAWGSPSFIKQGIRYYAKYV
jgi:hypothetical protein